MAPTLATFASLASGMVKTKAICLNIQLISCPRTFEAKVIITMFITKFLVTIEAAVGVVAAPTEHTRTNIG